MRNVSILANKTKKSSLRPSVAFEMSGPGVMSTVRRRSQVSAAICQTHCLDDDVLHRKGESSTWRHMRRLGPGLGTQQIFRPKFRFLHPKILMTLFSFLVMSLR